MFELTLSITIDKQKYLIDLQKKLLEEIKDDSFLAVCHNDNGRTFLAVASNESKKEYLKAKILNGILEIIINEYKYNFFKENLMAVADNLILLPFLKAISIFDADSDYEIIKNEIDLRNEVLIDSFFYFKLQSLKQKWEKTAAVIIKNGIIQSNTSMIQIIKYLADSSENFILVASIKIDDKKIQLKNYKTTKTFKTDDDGVSKFLTELISLNPLKINLTKNIDFCQKSKICDVLDEIFGEKIYLQN